MLSNVLPAALYRMQAAVGEALADAVVVLEGGWLCIDSKFPLDNFRRTAFDESGLDGGTFGVHCFLECRARSCPYSACLCYQFSWEEEGT